MSQVKSSVLYFFLLILQVSFDFSLDIVNKCNGFSKTLLEKSLESVLYKKNNPVPLNLSFILLLAKVNSISEKQSYKKDELVIFDTNYVKIMLTLLTKVVLLHIQAFII